jgi:hypothetical protein
LKKWVALAAAVLLLAGGLYFGSAYLAARNLKEAALSADADKLDAAVDFPSVRESLKSQMSTALMKKMNDDPQMKDNPFAGLGMMMMPAIVDRAVDTFVTSDGLAALVRGTKPAEAKDAPRTENPDVQYDYQWVSADRFRVKLTNVKKHEPGPSLVFDRRGFATWKLIKVELPDGIFEDSSSAQGK